MDKVDPKSGARQEAAEPPRDLEEIRVRTSPRRWRVYETTRQVLEEIEGHFDWEAIYDLEEPLGRFLEWGLFLEGTIARAGRRLREVAADEASTAAGGEPDELEDQLYWGTRQIASGLDQPLSVLRREMVESVTAGASTLPEAADDQRKPVLAIPMAEVAGKLRNDLRKFTAFVIAGERWDPDDLELLLFPAKHEELARGQRLKAHLVEAVGSFNGSTDRLPIAQVIQMWRHGQVHGQAALAEIDLLLRRISQMLSPADRKALYVDSFFRLRDWLHHLEVCSQGLRENLGDAAIEETLIKEIAAILDSELLAEILGEALLVDHELPRDAGEEFLPYLTRRAIGQVGLKSADRDRLLQLKQHLPEKLLPEDAELLRKAVAKIRGKKLVDLLRMRAPLGESMRDLEHLHPVVLESEDGLRTYLTLLYGQIQNRDLHLLKVDPRDIPMAEKRLAVQEFEYRLASLRGGEDFEILAVLRERIGEGVPSRQEASGEEWEAFRRLLRRIHGELVPRLERLCTFAEFSGMAGEDARAFALTLEQLESFEEPPAEAETAAAHELLRRLEDRLVQLDGLSLTSAPPQTEAEIEQFLDMLG